MITPKKTVPPRKPFEIFRVTYTELNMLVRFTMSIKLISFKILMTDNLQHAESSLMMCYVLKIQKKYHLNIDLHQDDSKWILSQKHAYTSEAMQVL